MPQQDKTSSKYKARQLNEGKSTKGTYIMAWQGKVKDGETRHNMASHAMARPDAKARQGIP